jgi:hypothetical protein
MFLLDGFLQVLNVMQYWSAFTVSHGPGTASRNAVGNTFLSVQNSVLTLSLSIEKAVSMEWEHTKSSKKKEAKTMQSVGRLLTALWEFLVHRAKGNA